MSCIVKLYTQQLTSEHFANIRAIYGIVFAHNNCHLESVYCEFNSSCKLFSLPVYGEDIAIFPIFFFFFIDKETEALERQVTGPGSHSAGGPSWNTNPVLVYPPGFQLPCETTSQQTWQVRIKSCISGQEILVYIRLNYMKLLIFYHL